MKNTFEFYPRYSSINAESASEFKKIPANRARVIKAGTPVITFTDILGRNYRFSFRIASLKIPINLPWVKEHTHRRVDLIQFRCRAFHT